MNKAQIKHMADRFLGWRLPQTWNPDAGISYKRPNYAHAPADHDWPIGTNLFSAEEATAMVAYMAEGLPSSDKFAWLIEAPGPSYLAVRELTNVHQFIWTRDHSFALQFADERQADMAMMAIRLLSPELFAFERTLGNARPVEHGWMAVAA